MTVEVTRVSFTGGTIGIGFGTDVDTGKEVRFGGDHRPMSHIAEALDAGEEVVVELEDWQILG